MRRSVIFSVFLAVLFVTFSGIAQELSSTPPSMPPEANPPVIDSFTILGPTQFTDAEMKSALTQHVGDKVTIIAVQADLRALAALYYTDPSQATEGWSGFALVTPRVTVTPEIAHPSEGHVTIKYIVAETSP